MQPDRKIEILRNCTFLAGAEEAVLARLAASTHTLTVPGDEQIIAKGEAGSTMYFLAEGRVRVHDDEVVLAHLEAGQVFGEMAVLDSDVRSASVSAEQDSVLLSLERDDLWRTISASPAALKTIIAAVLQRERKIVHDVTTRSTQVLAYEKELEIGRRIQADFLPERLPEAEGWEIAAHFEAAREVAGDFYDAFALQPTRHIAFVIGDVCDKGVGAALFMTLFRSLIRATCQMGILKSEGSGSDEASEDYVRDALQNSIEATNRYIATTHANSSMFASVFFGVLDPDTGRMLYINAGHESPMIFNQSGKCEVLEVTGGVLGLFPFARHTIAETVIGPGELMFAYTDGINEAKNEEGGQFGDDRIVAAGREACCEPEEFLDEMLRRIKHFRGNAPQSDDITMLALKRLSG